jgi:hypothetical protein
MMRRRAPDVKRSVLRDELVWTSTKAPPMKLEECRSRPPRTGRFGARYGLTCPLTFGQGRRSGCPGGGWAHGGRASAPGRIGVLWATEGQIGASHGRDGHATALPAALDHGHDDPGVDQAADADVAHGFEQREAHQDRCDHETCRRVGNPSEGRY